MAVYDQRMRPAPPPREVGDPRLIAARRDCAARAHRAYINRVREPLPDRITDKWLREHDKILADRGLTQADFDADREQLELFELDHNLPIRGIGADGRFVHRSVSAAAIEREWLASNEGIRAAQSQCDADIVEARKALAALEQRKQALANAAASNIEQNRLVERWKRLNPRLFAAEAIAAAACGAAVGFERAEHEHYAEGPPSEIPGVALAAVGSR